MLIIVAVEVIWNEIRWIVLTIYATSKVVKFRLGSIDRPVAFLADSLIMGVGFVLLCLVCVTGIIWMPLKPVE